MSQAWLFQDDKQLKKVGPERASWYVGWLDPDGKLKKVGPERASWYVGWLDPDGKRRCKSFGPGAQGKKHAFRFKEKVEGQLREGTYKAPPKMTWTAFRAEYDRDVLAAKDIPYREAMTIALGHFQRIVRPG